MTNDETNTPALHVAQDGTASGGPGAWDVTFAVTNETGGPATLRAAWLPHGRFRCEERALAVDVLAGDAVRLTFTVAFDEPEGEVVENCFVILRASWLGQEWRVLTRLTVTAGPGGAPQAATELITAHPVGFSV